MQLRMKFGNHKLGDDTGIFNMGTAKDCPARKLGMCEVINKGIKCYAEKPEQQYPTVVPAYRENQRKYWETTPVERIVSDISQRINKRRKETRYIRFNESGDFYAQEDVDKLSIIAGHFKTIGITTYGYTARQDLDFSRAEFLVKGSGHDKGNNGTCRVILKGEPIPEGFLVCPMDCRKCNLCKITVPHNIAFPKH